MSTLGQEGSSALQVQRRYWSQSAVPHPEGIQRNGEKSGRVSLGEARFLTDAPQLGHGATMPSSLPLVKRTLA